MTVSRLAVAKGVTEASCDLRTAVIRGSGRLVYVGPFGIEHDEAAGAFAAGGGGQAGVLEDEVERAPVARVHGGEWVGPSGGADALNRLGRGLAHMAIAVGFEVVCIEGDKFLLVELQAQDLDCDVLECAQHLTVVCGEEVGVRPAELDAEGATRVLGLVLRGRACRLS